MGLGEVEKVEKVYQKKNKQLLHLPEDLSEKVTLLNSISV